jgi:hypothetical protein
MGWETVPRGSRPSTSGWWLGRVDAALRAETESVDLGIPFARITQSGTWTRSSGWSRRSHWS